MGEYNTAMKPANKTKSGFYKRNIIVIFICIIFFVTGIYTAIGVYVYNASVHAVNQERRALSCKAEFLEKHGFDVEKFEEKYGVQEIMIPSTFDGHMIPAYYLLADGNEQGDTVVMAHGLNGNRLTAYPVAEMFLRNGFNVLTYDQRASGESNSDYMTCGYWESYDFKDCVNYITERVDPDHIVGGWGSSIGGATIGFYLGTEEAQEALAFAVLDCPVSDMSEIITSFLTRKESWIPEKVRITSGSMVNHIMLGFGYDDGNVCEYVKDSSVPILIFNTKIDKVTPYHMGVDLYESIKCKDKKLITVEDSSHTDIYMDHPEFYEDNMMDFVRNRN